MGLVQFLSLINGHNCIPLGPSISIHGRGAKGSCLDPHQGCVGLKMRWRDGKLFGGKKGSQALETLFVLKFKSGLAFFRHAGS